MLVRSQQLGAAPTDLAAHIARQIGKADIIALDTQSRFSGASENDNIAGAVFISTCETIAILTGAAVVVLSHTGKQVAREGIIDQYVSRGASAFSDNARSVMVLASPSKDAMNTLEFDSKAVECGDVFRLTHVKSNYAKKAADVYFQRLENGVVMPLQLIPKRVASGDELGLKLLAHIGAGGEIRRNDVYNDFRTIFGGNVKRAQALDTFDNAIRDGKLMCKRRYRCAGYYAVVNASPAEVINAPIRTKLDSIRELVGDL
jgi:hypothetical protein